MGVGRAAEGARLLAAAPADGAVDQAPGEAAGVDVGVVSGTQQRKVVDVGLAEVCGPFAQMVGLAPGRWSVTAGEGAAPVP